MAKITTEKAFEKWLTKQPEQVERVIAVRAALRAFPAVLKAVAGGDATQFALALLTGRANLTSVVGGTVPTADATLVAAFSAAFSAVYSAARSAADSSARAAALSAAGPAAYSAADSAFSAANAAAGSAANAAAGSAAFSATFADANEVQSSAPERLFQRRLWQDQPIPDGLAQDWAGFLASDASRHPDWAFWRDWYQGFLDGKPMDFALQRRIALIEDADWEKGAAHIAGKIDAIKAGFLAEKLPLAETIEINPDTGKFRAVPIAVQNPALLGTLLAAVGDALEDAVQGNNGLNMRSHEVRVLRRTLERYGNDPQRIETDFTSVAISLRGQIASGELPDDAAHQGVLRAVEQGALGVRGSHPEVAANRLVLAMQAMGELSVDEKEQISAALPVLQEISEGKMAEDFTLDFPALINDAIRPPGDFAPRLPGADEAARLFGRVAKISPLLRPKQFIMQVHGSAGYKTVDIITKIKTLIDIGLAIFGVLF